MIKFGRCQTLLCFSWIKSFCTFNYSTLLDEPMRMLVDWITSLFGVMHIYATILINLFTYLLKLVDRVVVKDYIRNWTKSELIYCWVCELIKYWEKVFLIIRRMHFINLYCIWWTTVFKIWLCGLDCCQTFESQSHNSMNWKLNRLLISAEMHLWMSKTINHIYLRNGRYF